MTRRLLMRWAFVSALVLSVCIAGAVAPPVAARAATTAPESWCKDTNARLKIAKIQESDRRADGTSITKTPAADGRYTPILLVHGFNGDSGIWRAQVTLNEVAGITTTWRSSLQGALQALPGAAVFTYDYAASSKQWVTQDSIGEDLGRDIDCLAKASGGKVIVVAHSMGGLALRYALELGGSARAAQLAEVITLGTPNTGSQIASIIQAVNRGVPLTAQGATLFIFFSVLRTACLAASNPVSICRGIDSVWTNTQTAASKALASGSPELAALSEWPAGVHVLALNGDMDVEFPRLTWWKQPLDRANHVGIGDGLVTPDSARGGARDSGSVSCSTTLSRLTAEYGQSACAHGNLARGVTLAGDVRADVSQTLRALHARFDALSMEVPAMCGQDAGRMKNGLFPPGSTPGMVQRTPLDWVYTDRKDGLSDGTTGQKVNLSETQPPTDANRKIAAATAVGCFKGYSPYGWGPASPRPDTVVFSAADGSLLASFDLARVTEGAHSYIKSIALHGTSATVAWFGSGPQSVGLADDYLTSTATFTYTGSKILAVSNRTSHGELNG